MLGPLGAVLAVPLTLLVKAVLVDAHPGASWVSSMLAAGAVPSDEGTTVAASG